MPRLIDAHEVYKYLRDLGGCDAEPGSWSDGWDKAIDTAIDGLDDIPTLDPVRAAGGCYCGECKYWTGGFDGRCLMHSRGEDVIWFSYASDFCRRGKRRE